MAIKPVLLDKDNKRKVVTFFVHLVCLSLIFFVPEVLASLSRRSATSALSAVPYIKSAIWVSAFYISYYLTADPTTGRRRDIVRFILQDLLILIGAVAAMYFLWEYLRSGLHPAPHHNIPDNIPPRPHRGPGVMAFLIRDGVVTILALGLALALKFVDKFHVMEKQQREFLEREREAELQQLRAQLNPHFLFNTLNSIYALVEIDPSKARDAIHRLSKMLRYMLYENQGSVTLGDEIRFLESYVELMRLRLPSSISSDINLNAGNCENKPIAPLLFINLFENAFKHGTNAPTTAPVIIHITTSGNTVTCLTSNAFDNIPGNSQKHGIGMTNLRRRLELQYPGRHSLSVDSSDRYIVTLTIDISSPPEMSFTSN